MFEHSSIFFKETSTTKARMGKNEGVKKARIAKMLEETYSTDEFEKKLKNALIGIRIVSVEN
ncbi:MAG: hypothetical protein MJ000_04780 [Bacteroidales bacterium]|nr:hypothetical protein [Bacteroidales bacterium]